MYMKNKYIMLTPIVPSRSQGKRMDHILLQSLIDELNQLWEGI